MMFHRRRREEPHIDLTSLVDVVFLLLIFFMISTTFIQSPGLGIDLPRAASQRQPDKAPEVKVGLTRDGQLLGDGKVLSAEQLTSLLRRRLAESPDAVFVLQADRQVPHGRVVQWMDLAKTLGYRKLAIATEPRIPRVAE